MKAEQPMIITAEDYNHPKDLAVSTEWKQAITQKRMLEVNTSASRIAIFDGVI